MAATATVGVVETGVESIRQDARERDERRIGNSAIAIARAFEISGEALANVNETGTAGHTRKLGDGAGDFEMIAGERCGARLLALQRKKNVLFIVERKCGRGVGDATATGNEGAVRHIASVATVTWIEVK